MFRCCLLPNFLWLFWNLIQGTNLAWGKKKCLPSESQHLFTGLVLSSEDVKIGPIKVFGMRLLNYFACLILRAWK